MSWLWIAVSASLALGVVALCLSLLALRASHKELRRVRGSHRRLENELAVANSAAIGMGHRLLAMEKRVNRGEADTPGEPAESDAPYTEAQQLFGMGESVETVVERCGLSHAEASLLQAMQAHQRPQR